MKVILFDLDGVITDTKDIHYKALNESLAEIDPKFIITREEHLDSFDGLKTWTKLDMLTERKGLPKELHNKVYARKQELTIKKFSEIDEDLRMIDIFKRLRSDGYILGCCTNCISRTGYTAIANVGVMPYLDLVLTNTDVYNSKPHPEIYWKAMSMLSSYPEDTLIIEDSPQGLQSAFSSGAHVLRVNNSSDLTYSKINNFLNQEDLIMNQKWKDNKLNVLIPMAGAGSRFQQAGYTFPKPLIDVDGKPMIQRVVDSLKLDANFIYIVQKEHREKYNLDTLLNLITPDCKIIEINEITEGAACTALLAKEYINNSDKLIISNSDQYIDWDSLNFMYSVNEKEADGAIVTFKATHPKWSFAKVNDKGLITEVAEKNPISDNATAGIYFWKRGSDFVKSAEQMIEKDIRVNNEFYVCPVYNEFISEDTRVLNYEIAKESMWGLGTPEDLEYFLNHYNPK